MPHLERAEAALALLPPRGSRDLLFGQSASGFNNYPQAKERLSHRRDAGQAARAVDHWADHLMEAVNGSDANVVPLRQAG
jgi:hypothetical protein